MKLHIRTSRDYSVPHDYNFKLTASTYNFSWYFNGIKLVVPIDYYRSVVALVEKVENGKLKVSLCSSDILEDVEDYFEKVEYTLGFNEDLTELYNVWSRDPLLSKSLKYLRGLHLRAQPLWTSILIGICQQNASFKQGWKMLAMIYKVLGRSVEVEGYGKSILPPTPKDLFKCDSRPLKACGLGYRDVVVIEVAKKFCENVLEDDVKVGYEEDELTRIKGVGPYTARLALILSSRRYELAPVDRWLKRIISEVYKVPEVKAESEWVKRWGKWVGYASVLATIALDAEVLSVALSRIKKGLTYPQIAKNEPTPLTLWKYI